MIFNLVKMLAVLAIAMCCMNFAAAFQKVAVQEGDALQGMGGRDLMGSRSNGEEDDCWKYGRWKWLCKNKWSLNSEGRGKRERKDRGKRSGSSGDSPSPPTPEKSSAASKDPATSPPSPAPKKPSPNPSPKPSPVAAKSTSEPKPEPMPEPKPEETQTASFSSSPAPGSNKLSDNIDKSWGSCSDSMVADMVAADNADRSGGNLKCDDKLSQMAMEHSRDQCKSRNMGHQGFKDSSGDCGGNSRCARITGDLGYRASGENVAYRGDDLDKQVATTHDAWMNSEGHRKNIQNTGFTAVGYGFYVCENAEGGNFNVVYSTGLFGG